MIKSHMVENADFIQDPDNYSELQILSSAAGYYVGTIYTNKDGFQEPGSRDSDYFKTEKEANIFLNLVTIGTISIRESP